MNRTIQWTQNTLPPDNLVRCTNPDVQDVDPPDEINEEYDGVYWFNETTKTMFYNNKGRWTTVLTAAILLP